MSKKFLVTFALLCGASLLLWQVFSPDESKVPSRTTAEEKEDLQPFPQSDGPTQFRVPRPTASIQGSEFNNQDLTPGISPSAVTPAFLGQLEVIASAAPKNFLLRHAAVEALRQDLNPEQVRALYDFLTTPPPGGDLERVHDRVIKNDVLNQLRKQDEPPEGLTALLVGMFNDSDQDEAVRDYTLQQLRIWRTEAPGEEHSLILDTMLRAVEETEGSIGGTALLALRDFEKLTDAAAHTEVASVALKMASDETGGELSRITAMQVAAEGGGQEALALGAQWALDPSYSYPRRLSAIAALGAAGSEEAAEILAQVETYEDPYLQPALHSAYERLRRTGIKIEQR